MAENGEIHEPCSEIANFFMVKKLSSNAIMPCRGSSLSAGYDLFSAAEAKVPARGEALIPTDISIAIPKDAYGRIASRSGLALKHSIDARESVIDADYRGSIDVILNNNSDLDFFVKPGDRIAQLIIHVIITPNVVKTKDLDYSIREADGFGSTELQNFQRANPSSFISFNAALQKIAKSTNNRLSFRVAWREKSTNLVLKSLNSPKRHSASSR